MDAPRAGLLSLQAALAGGSTPDLLPAVTAPDAKDRDGGVRRLVDRARAGDGDAFGALYDRYVDTIYRYVYYRVGTPSLAEDLVSETFLRALRGINTFRWQGVDFGAWLTTIARNLITDHYKSSRYRLEVANDQLLDHAGETTPGADSIVIDRETTHRLLDAVRRLPGDQQECIVLRFLQGLSLAETAAVMHRGEGAVKALQYRATRALEQLLEQGGRP